MKISIQNSFKVFNTSRYLDGFSKHLSEKYQINKSFLADVDAWVNKLRATGEVFEYIFALEFWINFWRESLMEDAVKGIDVEKELLGILDLSLAV